MPKYRPLIAFLIVTVLNIPNNIASIPNFIGEKVLKTDTLVLRIDPKTALNDSASASDIVETTDYIPLQTPENMYVGRIDQLEISDEFLFVLDKSNKVVNSRTQSAIFVFNKNGMFHSVISVTKCSYFALNRQLKQIIFRDDNSHTDWLVYDYQGKLIRKEPRLLEFSTFDFLDNGAIAYYKNYSYFKNTGNSFDSAPALSTYNLLIAKNGEITGKYLPFDTTNIINSTGLFRAGKYFYRSDKLYIIPGYNYQCYEIDEQNTVKNRMTFVFPLQYTLPADFVSQTLDKKKGYFQRHSNIIYAISNFYHIGSFYIFQLNFSQAPPQVFFYDMEAKMLTAWSMINTDKTTSHLALGESILASEGKFFYSAITESDIKRSNEENIKSQPNRDLPDPIKLYLTKKSIFVKNPVLVRYKIRG